MSKDAQSTEAAGAGRNSGKIFQRIIDAMLWVLVCSHFALLIILAITPLRHKLLNEVSGFAYYVLGWGVLWLISLVWMGVRAGQLPEVVQKRIVHRGKVLSAIMIVALLILSMIF